MTRIISILKICVGLKKKIHDKATIIRDLFLEPKILETQLQANQKLPPYARIETYINVPKDICDSIATSISSGIIDKTLFTDAVSYIFPVLIHFWKIYRESFANTVYRKWTNLAKELRQLRRDQVMAARKANRDGLIPMKTEVKEVPYKSGDDESRRLTNAQNELTKEGYRLLSNGLAIIIGRNLRTKLNLPFVDYKKSNISTIEYFDGKYPGHKTKPENKDQSPSDHRSFGAAPPSGISSLFPGDGPGMRRKSVNPKMLGLPNALAHARRSIFNPDAGAAIRNRIRNEENENFVAETCVDKEGNAGLGSRITYNLTDGCTLHLKRTSTQDKVRTMLANLQKKSLNNQDNLKSNSDNSLDECNKFRVVVDINEETENSKRANTTKSSARSKAVVSDSDLKPMTSEEKFVKSMKELDRKNDQHFSQAQNRLNSMLSQQRRESRKFKVFH